MRQAEPRQCVVFGSGAQVTKTISCAEIAKRRCTVRNRNIIQVYIALTSPQGVHQNTQIFYTRSVISPCRQRCLPISIDDVWEPNASAPRPFDPYDIIYLTLADARSMRATRLLPSVSVLLSLPPLDAHAPGCDCMHLTPA